MALTDIKDGRIKITRIFFCLSSFSHIEQVVDGKKINSQGTCEEIMNYKQILSKLYINKIKLPVVEESESQNSA